MWLDVINICLKIEINGKFLIIYGFSMRSSRFCFRSLFIQFWICRYPFRLWENFNSIVTFVLSEYMDKISDVWKIFKIIWYYIIYTNRRLISIRTSASLLILWASICVMPSTTWLISFKPSTSLLTNWSRRKSLCFPYRMISDISASPRAFARSDNVDLLSFLNGEY